VHFRRKAYFLPLRAFSIKEIASFFTLASVVLNMSGSNR
jgi:hypothetical protein